MEKGIIALAAALCACAGCVTGIFEGKIGIQAVESTGKNPEAADQIRSTAIVSAAISETCAIYCLLVAILLIFVLGS